MSILPYTIPDLERIAEASNKQIEREFKEAGFFSVPGGPHVSTAIVRIVLTQAAAPDLLVVCQELTQAMVDYQMEVDDEFTHPPYKHTKMMERARAAIAKAQGLSLIHI